jgi:hypothetical protein
MTYAELLQKIRDYTEVDSNVLTDTICNGFIQDAEWSAAVAVLDFTTDKSASDGTFTIIFPDNTSAAAILRISG